MIIFKGENMEFLYIKAFHIMALVSWMAMLFYLPRLFVYHAQHRDIQAYVEIVKKQEWRLYKYIGIPALIFTLLTGLALIALNPDVFKVAVSGLWLHIKLVCVLCLLIYHLMCGYFIKTLGNGSCTKSHRFFRFFNEIPTLLLIIIVILVVCKPI